MCASDTERSAPGKSVVKFDNSQCSYRLGIRAAAIRDPARARIWQSQRVTPRSADPETVLHPEPAHKGQTSVADFMIVYLDCAPPRPSTATRKRPPPVYFLCRAGIGCGE